MLSSTSVRLLASLRSMHSYKNHFLRVLSTAEAVQNENLSGNREKGVVKRFSKEKGYGFISRTSDGTDYFVHFKNINITGFKLLEQGQEVEFTAVQGEKGMEARDVNVLKTETGPRLFTNRSFKGDSTSPRVGFGAWKNRSSPSPFDFGGTNSSELNLEEDSESTDKPFNSGGNLRRSSRNSFFSPRNTQTNADQTRELGSVKRWTPERGFGFIRRTNGGSDLFCHVRSLKDGLRGLEQGQKVEFSIQQTEKGEEACDVTILNDEDGTSQSQEATSNLNLGERQTGIVKRWLSGKGYGFVQPNNGGPDVFVHLQNLSGGLDSLVEGQKVEFNVAKSEKGETAQNVTVLREN